MKIVVIGGSGLIGSNLVKQLRTQGHEVIAASPSTGINALTGEGLAAALTGAHVVVDVSNSPSFEDAPVLAFFETSTRNLLRAEAEAGIQHHLALSVVGADRLPDSGYMRAKVAQERLIQAGPIPYTIVRATQFFEFLGRIVDTYTEGDTAHLSNVLMQPLAAADVSTALAGFAVAPPLNATTELAGPEPIRLDELARRLLAAKGDPRQVVTVPHAGYFGAAAHDQSITPGLNPHLAPTTFAAWLARP